MRILFSLLLLLALLGAGPAHAAASDGFVAHSTGWSSFVASGNSEPSPTPAVDGHGGETDGHEAADADPHETGGHHAEQSRTGIPLVLLAVLLFYSAAALTLGLIRRRQA